MNDENKVVAVRVEGAFTEWYSPYYEEPYEDDEGYRQYYNEHILDIQPVVGPSLGESEDEFIVDDLQCLAERMCCNGIENWSVATDKFMKAVEEVLKRGETKNVTIDGIDFRMTPYRKKELPPINEKSLEVYGDYKNLIRERVENI